MKLLLPFLLVTSVISGEISLDAVLQSAEKSSATIQAVEAKLTALEKASNYFTAGGNPELEVGTENFGISEFEIVLSQELRFNKQKEPARHQLDRIRKEAEVTVESTRRDLLSSVIESYLEVALLQDESALLDSITESINEETVNLQKRFDAGATSKLELLEQKGLLIELQELKFTLQSEYRSALAKLNSFSDTSYKGNVEQLTQLGIHFQTAKTAEISENHPDLLELNAAQFEAELLGMKSAASKTPNLSVSSGYKRNNEESANAFLLGFTLELPFSKEAELSKLESEILTATVTLKRTEVIRSLNAQLEQFRERVTVAEERIRILREERIPLALEKSEAAQVQFTHGNLPITEKIRYKRELIQLQQEELQLLHGYLTALSDISLFTGTLK